MDFQKYNIKENKKKKKKTKSQKLFKNIYMEFALKNSLLF